MASENGHQATVKTRILIISDTHAAPLEHDPSDGAKRPPVPPFKAPLPEADLLIHAGDLTMMGRMSEYHDTLDMLKTIKAPAKLVIAGNHDLSLDHEYMRSHLDEGEPVSQADQQASEARQLWTSPEGRAKQEGVTFLDEGSHLIRLPNGAEVKIYASPYTPEFCDWGFPYEHNEDRFNTPSTSLSDAINIAPYPVPSFRSEIGAPVDITITHGPPYQRLDWTISGDRVGCPHLLRAMMRARPLLSVFGHIHEGWGAERVAWTPEADAVCDQSCKINDWKNGAWKAGVAGNGQQIERLQPDLEKAEENHGVLLDVSSGSERPLVRGNETLMVNAAIMDVSYKPVNGPWLVTLDLPKAP
ncbi:hypothetical protein AC578_10699 [Pseudocercospora eumusae]|uniref:Calcineurin-like phosphoesterase domain-containing protein n=1 Tax=Pseudocercospora eumusae TaxID=321146 RepID=A0A139HJI3_9PEZI|nr:hypothetical protein AC578_10699 [Pseudocercospora eumusae]